MRRRREFEGPIYTWGAVRGTTRRTWSPLRREKLERGVERFERGAPPPGEWQWRGHGPGAWGGYGWDYRGGAPRGEDLTWPERVPGRGMGGGRILEERRGGGLPRSLRMRRRRKAQWAPEGAGPASGYEFEYRRRSRRRRG